MMKSVRRRPAAVPVMFTTLVVFSILSNFGSQHSLRALPVKFPQTAVVTPTEKEPVAVTAVHAALVKDSPNNSSNVTRLVSFETIQPVAQNFTTGTGEHVGIPSSTPKLWVLTSFFRGKKDPQRSGFAPSKIDYLANLNTTARYLGINVLIVHDHISKNVQEQFETDSITFYEDIGLTNTSYSINDYRFFVYETILQKDTRLRSASHVLMVDASDTFFWSNPMHYMNHHGNYSLFLSGDSGTFKTNSWVTGKMKRCYVSDFLPQLGSSPVQNAGVWGGKTEAVQCIIRCMKEKFISISKRTDTNCNMAVYNWCVRFSGCAPDGEIDFNSKMVNPFRGKCLEQKYHVVHNKCGKTEGKLCLKVVDGNLRAGQGNGNLTGGQGNKCSPIAP